MTYSVDDKTKIATYNKDEFYPKIVWTDSKTKNVIALTEDECKELAALRAAQPEANLNALREVRNSILAQSDWTQNRDVTLSNDADWKTYRQALRDITKTYKTLEDVEWPEEPTT